MILFYVKRITEWEMKLDEVPGQSWKAEVEKLVKVKETEILFNKYL